MNNPFASHVRVPISPGIQIELPLSRSTDHTSSFEAVDTLSKSGKLAKQRIQVRYWLSKYCQHTGSYPTSKELANYFLVDRHMVARRLPDLEKLNLVERIAGDGELRWRVK